MEKINKLALTALLTLGMTGLAAGCSSNSQSASNSTSNNSASKGKYVIALSNSYYGNTWRHQMVQAFETAAKKAKAEGLISDYVIENADGTQNQQLSQMNDLILKHVNAIVIDSASPTALNGAIAKAEAAGIKVISFDSVVTDPKAYKLTFDFQKLGKDTAQYVVDRINGKGNVLVIRGVAGSAPDHDMYQGAMDVLNKNPNIKVVGTVYGQATTSVTMSQVSGLLPSLPKVDAVICQGGGDDYGVVQAFQAANKPMPIITGGGEAEFVHWWMDENKKSGYTTFSESSTPGIGGAAFWTALNILQGANAQNTMVMPNVVIKQADLSKYADMKPNTIASPDFTNDWVKKNILAQK
jgi:ribose transport system substrate-binding protein